MGGKSKKAAKASLVSLPKTDPPLQTPEQATCKLGPPAAVLTVKPVLVVGAARPHRVPVELRVTGKFDGKGTLTGDADLELSRNLNGSGAVVLPAELTAEELTKGLVLYVAGKTASARADDTELVLTLSGSSKPPDKPRASAKLTRVQVKLDLHEARLPHATWSTPPPRIADDRKLDPGRTLYKQGAKFRSARALLRVTKTPHDAPCTLLLQAVGDKVRVYDRESHSKTETLIPLPRRSDPGTFTALQPSLDLWVEGAALTGKVRETLQLGVVDAEEDCDRVGLEVVSPAIEVEVLHHDHPKTVAGLLTLELKGAATVTAEVDPSKPPTRIELDADDYTTALTLRGADLGLQITRKLPSHGGATIDVKDGAPAKAQFVLEPPSRYSEIQLVGYFVESGAYKGTDDPKKFAPKVSSGDVEKDRAQAAKDAALHDLEQRCTLMKDAIVKAHGKGTVKTDAKVLKIFMAPEFYFRGAQGAYPSEVAFEVMNKMRAETDLPKYKDWLFVFGTVVASIERDKKREDWHGKVERIIDSELSVSFPGASEADKVAAGWSFWIADSANKWTRVPGTGELAVTQAALLGSDKKGNRYHTLTLEGAAVLDPPTRSAPGSKLGLWSNTAWPVTYPAGAVKRVTLQLDCPPSVKLAAGWTVVQGAARGEVKEVTPSPPKVVVEIPVDQGFDLSRTVDLLDGGSTLAASPKIVALVPQSQVIVNIAATGLGAGVAPGWKFLVSAKAGGWAAPREYAITKVHRNSSMGPVTLFVDGLLPFDPAAPIGVWNGEPYPVSLYDRHDSYKILRFAISSSDVPKKTPAMGKGWYLEQGAIRGAFVEDATAWSVDRSEIKAAIPLNARLDTKDVLIVDPGEIEIMNVALVRRGGTGVTLGADGKRDLKEAIIYKETISLVDFMGLDYGKSGFEKPERHLVEIHGDRARRVIPIQGSTDTLGTKPNVAGMTFDWTDANGVKHTRRISEVNESGLGGGCVFTMDGITFGLEVCRDHLVDRLHDYYTKTFGSTGRPAAAIGEPKVQVQLIPSCGAEIVHPCCVADGLVFNIDSYAYDAAKDGGGTKIKPVTAEPIATIPKGITLADYFDSAGTILVYDPLPTPTKGTVS